LSPILNLAFRIGVIERCHLHKTDFSCTIDTMEFTYSTPALLFPAISLLFISYTNRFVTYANLIRNLHAEWQKDKEAVLIEQIENLRLRIKLIKRMQLSGSLALIACVACMLLLFFGQIIIAEILFSIALLGMATSLIFLIMEIRISMDALNLQLRDMEGDNTKK